MDEEIERLVVSVRADTSAFARDVSAMRGELEGPLAQGAARAGRPAAITRERIGEAVVAQGLAQVTPALRVVLGQILSGQ